MIFFVDIEKPTLILTLHSPQETGTESDMTFGDKYILCIWRSHSLSMPCNILVSNMTPLKDAICSLSYGFIICGTDEGYLQLWNIKNDSWNFRKKFPFNGSFDHSLHHLFKEITFETQVVTQSECILNISNIPEKREFGWNTSEVVLLDSRGFLTFW